MTKDPQFIIDELRKTKPLLREQYGIEKIAVFGSVAKGVANDASDVDIVILDMKYKNGFLVAKAKQFLKEQIGREVDIGLYDSLNPFIKKQIARDMINV